MTPALPQVLTAQNEPQQNAPPAPPPVYVVPLPPNAVASVQRHAGSGDSHAASDFTREDTPSFPKAVILFIISMAIYLGMTALLNCRDDIRKLVVKNFGVYVISNAAFLVLFAIIMNLINVMQVYSLTVLATPTFSLAYVFVTAFAQEEAKEMVTLGVLSSASLYLGTTMFAALSSWEITGCPCYNTMERRALALALGFTTMLVCRLLLFLGRFAMIYGLAVLMLSFFYLAADMKRVKTTVLRLQAADHIYGIMALYTDFVQIFMATLLIIMAQ